MATFVLVHGAWSGAHGLRHVRRRLWAEGHEAFTPSLTGVGERVHLTSPGVTLSTHVADVVNAVLYEDLDDTQSLTHFRVSSTRSQPTSSIATIRFSDSRSRNSATAWWPSWIA